MSERSGVEIDYCPTCRGVWLDRGELDRIIERFEGRPGRSYDRGDGSRPAGEPQHRFVEHRYGDRRRTKKKGVLAEIFDFD